MGKSNFRYYFITLTLAVIVVSLTGCRWLFMRSASGTAGIRQGFCSTYALNMAASVLNPTDSPSELTRKMTITNEYCVDKFTKYGKKEGHQAEMNVLTEILTKCSTMSEVQFVNCVHSIAHPKGIDMPKLNY